MEKKILEFINIILENNGKEKLNSFSGKMLLRDEIGLDSLDLAELTVRIESEYGIDIFEDGIIETIGEVLEKLNKNG